MLKKLFAYVTLAALIVSGCANPKSASNVTLYVLANQPGKSLLDINSRQWGGFWGPEGYVGHRYITYWAGLEGQGPIFHDPHFEDSPSDFNCIGDIVLDMQRREVT